QALQSVLLRSRAPQAERDFSGVFVATENITPRASRLARPQNSARDATAAKGSLAARAEEAPALQAALVPRRVLSVMPRTVAPLRQALPLTSSPAGPSSYAPRSPGGRYACARRPGNCLDLPGSDP